MEEWQTNFKVQALFTRVLFFFFKNNSLYDKRYSQGTIYHVINQLGPQIEEQLTNRSSMSNQDKKYITMQVPTSGVRTKHLRQTYTVTSSTSSWKSFPPWARLQDLGMNLYSSLFTYLSINLVWTKNHKFPHVIYTITILQYNKTMLQYYNIIRPILLYPCADSSD